MKPSTRPITTPYGKPGSWSGGKHGGADFGTPTGDPVYAMWGGKVIGVRSGSAVSGTTWGSAYGTQIVIDQDRLPNGNPGLWVVYAHLSKASVKVGDRVKPGQRIGSSGNTGNSTGPHLHVEVQRAKTWRSGNHVNPQPWIDAKESTPVTYKYEYSGKPKGTLAIPKGKYVTLDFDTPDPKVQGLELMKVYVNLAIVWPAGAKGGTVRVKFTRDGGDDTAYADFTVMPWQTEFLVGHTWMKISDANKGGRWKIKVTGDMTSVKAGTRYCAWGVVPK